jgi:hypothetical protein
MSTRESDVLEKEKYQPCVPILIASPPYQCKLESTSPNKHGVAEALLFILQGEKRLRRFTGKKSQGVEEKKLHVNFSGRLRLVEVSSHGKVRERGGRAKVEYLLSVRHMYHRYKDSICCGKDSISQGEQQNSALVLAVLVELWGWDWQQGHERFSRQLYLDS